jgi:Contractile injection system tube protein
MPKAFIENLDTGDRISVLFNPKEYSITKSNYWQRARTTGANLPRTTFSNGEPARMDIELFFDTYEEKMDVRRHTNKIAKLMEVNIREEGEGKKLRPPKVKFHWGLSWTFKAVITNMTQHFTLFLPTGTPVRATVNVTFEQIEEEHSFPGQNPTSGGAGGRRTHLVAAGETLDLISFQELGDARLWRQIAMTNGIVDPLHLVPGSVLTIQPEE